MGHIIWISQHDKDTTFGATKATMQRRFKSKCNEPSRRWLRWFDVQNRSYYFQINFNCYHVTIASKNLHWIKNSILVYYRNYTLGKLDCSSVTCSLILFITWISWSDRLGKVLFKSTRNCIIPVIDKYLQSGYLEYIALGWIVTTPGQDNQMTLDDLFV